MPHPPGASPTPSSTPTTSPTSWSPPSPSPGHAGQLYEVTGPRLLTFEDALAEIARATGREIRYLPISSQQYFDAMIAEGLPADFAQGLTDLFTEVLDGRSSYVTDGVRRALGREPKDFRDYARETAASDVWNVTQLEEAIR